MTAAPTHPSSSPFRKDWRLCLHHEHALAREWGALCFALRMYECWSLQLWMGCPRRIMTAWSDTAKTCAFCPSASGAHCRATSMLPALTTLQASSLKEPVFSCRAAVNLGVKRQWGACFFFIVCRRLSSTAAASLPQLQLIHDALEGLCVACTKLCLKWSKKEEIPHAFGLIAEKYFLSLPH